MGVYLNSKRQIAIFFIYSLVSRLCVINQPISNGHCNPLKWRSIQITGTLHNLFKLISHSSKSLNIMTIRPGFG